MNPETAEKVIDQLAVEFPGFLPSPEASSKPIVLRRLLQATCDDDILRSAVSRLVRSWRASKPPSVRDVLLAIDSTLEGLKGRQKLLSVYERARDLTLRYTPLMLSMSARYADEACPDCVAEYCGVRGVAPDDPLLFHRHFTIHELDDAALLLAVTNAKRDQPVNPFELKAYSESEESKAEKQRRMSSILSSFRGRPAAEVREGVEVGV